MNNTTCAWFSSRLSLLSSNFTVFPWHDVVIAREFQTFFRQRHQDIWRKIWNLSASLFLASSLICNILWASCQPLLTEIKVLPLSWRDIILYEHFAGFTTSNICPLALIWLSSLTGIHIIQPSSCSPSVLHPSLITIHNNSIKTSIQGLSWIIPYFKNKRYPSWQWWIHVLFSYWRSAFSLCSMSPLLCVSCILHLGLSPGPALFFPVDQKSTICGIKRQGSEEQSVSLSPLSPGRIRARRLLRNSHKVCSCLPGVNKKRERDSEDSDVKSPLCNFSSIK